MLELNSMIIRNFFSHSETSIDFDSLEGLVLLEGKNYDGRYDSNGSGKSSILEGIVYSLTGTTLRNVGVNDMVNRSVGKNTLCRLQLNNNGVDTVISRYRKDEEFGDSVKFYEGGKDLSSRLNKATQETIDTKLGVPYRILTNTILLGEGLSSRFTQLSDPDKKSLIESTLSLSYDVNLLRDKVNSYIKGLKDEVSALSGSIAAMEGMINSFNPDHNIEQSSEQLSRLETDKGELSLKLSDLKSKLELYSIKVKSLEDAKVRCESLHQEYAQVSSKINECQHNMQAVDHVNSSCTLCGQSLSSHESKAHIKSVYYNELVNLNSSLESINSQIQDLPEYSVIVNKLQDISVEYNSMIEEYNQVKVKFDTICRDVAVLESSISRDKVLAENVGNYTVQVETDKEQLISKEQDLSDYNYLYKLFSPTGLIVYILEDAISYINDRMRIYTEMLIDKSYEFKLVKGKLTLNDESGSSYQSLSNGEKRRLDICIQFSLHDYVYNYCGVQVDSLFVDEVLDTLDAVGVDNIFEVLRIKMEYCNLKRVIVITHNPNLKSHFDKVITVYKDEEGFSRII